jgi:uroporphyrinogen-III synthase
VYQPRSVQEGRKRGYDVRFVPVLSFRTGRDGKEKLREALQEAERFSGLVVTSQQAVHVRMDTPPPILEDIAHARHRPLMCVA